MKRFLPVCLLACALSGAVSAATLLAEDFEGSFPPTGWTAVSIDQSTTYAHAGSYSAKFSANTDSLITPQVVSPATLTFWSYTTSADPGIIVEQGAGTNGPWTAVSGSPFSGNTDQWNLRAVTIASTNSLYFRFTKSGSGSLYIDDVSFDDGIVTSNLPPVLDPIGNKAVLEMGSLSFPVTASDPVDGDPITLSATNLPTGATFSTNGLFSWSNAVPVGAYDVTFYATDKDGSTNETVTITVTERPKLLISEIADPSGTGGDVFRFVELYNAGTSSIDLASNSWTLCRQNNGTDWTDIPLTGTVASAKTYAIAKGTNFYTAYGFQPQQINSGVDGNGNDVYALYYGGDHTNGTLIDIYGQPDIDGTGTAWDYTDSRAVRNNNILQPNDIWTISEWTITPNASTNDMTPGEHGPIPEFQGLENVFVFLGDSLSLAVTAANTILTNDVITLSATALPTGATFSPGTGTNTVSSTLNWSSPTAGVYTATFAATGTSGTNIASITITVSSSSKITGYFYGWKGDTIFKLDNGQFWQQSVWDAKTFTPIYHPLVSITNYLGYDRRMYITNGTEHVAVKQLDVTESTVTNTFTGLQYQNFYQLADGTTWQQISFDTASSNTSSVTAWRWTENSQQKMRFLGRNNVVIGTCIVEASAPPTDTTIHSQIDGWFRGWGSKRVFALKNGQFWQQSVSDSTTETLYSPAVTITNWLQTGIWHMSVSGAGGTREVQQITNVTRTAVDRWFYGFGRDHIFSLTDGSWWKQTSSDVSTSTRFNPEVLIWSENGTDYLEMPDEGRTVPATELIVDFESTVTNTFTGLHYGNLYRLDGAGDWLQFSFENVSTNVSNPSVMLWTEGTLTNMIVRDSRNVTIGTCIVVDPILDADSDGFSNAAEVLAGSDPLDSQSNFTLRQTDHYILSWDAVEGRIYTIEWTPSLTESFQTLENSIAWPQNSWTDTVHAVSTEGFYRISVRLAD